MGVNKIMDKILIHGKSEEELKKLKESSIDAIVTDPPYHLTSIVKRFGKENSAPAKYGTDGVFSRASKGFMGKEWDGGDIAFNKEMWKECLRVLKPGGHLVAFSATRTYHRMATAIEDAGFEVRDMLEWIYAEGFPKSLNIGKKIDELLGNQRKIIGKSKSGNKNNGVTTSINSKGGFGHKEGLIDITKGNSDWEGFGTALKPAHEPIVLARKPLSEKTIVDNVLKYGTGAIDIDGCRIPNSVGRFPANIIVTDDALNDGKISKSIKAKQDKSGSGGIWEKSTGVPAGETYSDTGSNSRYFDIDHWATKYGLIQIPKASKSEKNEGCEGLETTEKFTAGNYSQSPTCEDCNLTINGTNDHSKCSGEVYYKKMESKNTKNNHPTVKPVHLMAWLVQLVSKKGDIVLDPFMGSGTTGVACMQLDRNFIGIEMEEDYIKIAESRIENEGSKPIQMNLFDKIIEPEEKKIKIEKIGLFSEGE